MKVDHHVLDQDQQIRMMGIPHKVELYWREIGTDKLWPNEQMRSGWIAGRDFEDINLAMEIPSGEVGRQASMQPEGHEDRATSRVRMGKAALIHLRLTW